MQTARRAVLLGLLSLTLSACGFHLSGYYDVPEALRQVQVSAPEERPSDIRQPLINLLKLNGIEITDAAPQTLKILQERTRQRTLTLTTGADAIEYELIASVRFQVLDAAGEPLSNEREARIERVFFDLENTTARDALISQVKQEMQQQLAQQIVRQYLSLQP